MSRVLPDPSLSVAEPAIANAGSEDAVRAGQASPPNHSAAPEHAALATIVTADGQAKPDDSDDSPTVAQPSAPPTPPSPAVGGSLVRHAPAPSPAALTQASTTRWRHVLAIGAIAGWSAGLIVGTVDMLAGLRAAMQFFSTARAGLASLVFSASLHAIAGALGGVALTLLAWWLWRGTRFGALVRAGLAAHDHAQRHAPERTQAGNALMLVGVPTLGLTALLLVRQLTLHLAQRKAFQLVIVSSVAATVGALVAWVLATFMLARPIEAMLARVAKHHPRSVLTAAWFPLAIALGYLALGGALGVPRSWPTLQMLPWRAALVIASYATLLVVLVAALRKQQRNRHSKAQVSVATEARSAPANEVATAATDTAPPRGPAKRHAWHRVRWPSITLVTLATSLMLSNHPPSLKATANHTGFGHVLITRAQRFLLDFDRDGYSRFFGGGDCDDFNRSVHPGAREIPDDGIDQNCLGGDTSFTTTPRDLAFVPVPSSVPADANIVLLTIDTTRADHLSSYGYTRATSPNLDALAQRGTRFVNSWAHAPSTRYSMPAILTGRLPLDVRYDTSIPGWPGLAPQATTIAELMSAKGLVTGAFTNYWYFDASRRMNQGFTEYDNQNARLHSEVGAEGPAHTRGSSSQQQSDKAIDFIARHQAQRFFMWVHYYDPHHEYENHREVPVFGTDEVARYDNEIAFTDFHIGRVLNELKARGLDEKTIVIVTGDHGEGFGEHGIMLHGYHLYAAQTRVPMIMRIPGLAPQVTTSPVGHIDILPTLANLVGYAPTDPLLTDAMGRSQLASLAGQPTTAPPVWQQLSYEGNHEMRAAADATCHVIFNMSPVASWEAYRVPATPDGRLAAGALREPVDIAGAPACAALATALARWVDATSIPAGAQAALLSKPPDAQPLAIDFGAAIRLVDAQFPPQLAPGAPFPLTLTFAATATPPPGWKVFVHIEGPTRFTADHEPVRPFEWWRAGQFIQYTTTAQVPAHAQPGTYTVWLGIWKGAERMPVRGAVRAEAKRVALGTLEVKP